MKKTIYLSLLFCALVAATALATTHTVTVANYQFTPSSVTAQVGDTIVWYWVNGDHTTTSTSIPAGATPWDEPISATNTSYSYKLTVAGIYDYHCTPHAPNMAGTITVQTAASVQEQAAVNMLPLYPNPAAGAFNLDLSAMAGDVDITIADAAGRVVRSIKVAGGQAAAVVTSGIPAGIYIVRAASREKSLAAMVSIQ
jgi:plastocyanin